MLWNTASGAWLFHSVSINVTKDPWWEEPCRRGALQQKGRKKKGKLQGDTGRACFSTLPSGCCAPGSAGCRSQVWMKSLVGCLVSLCFPLTPLSLSHTASVFIELLRVAQWQAVPSLLNMYEKTGKAYACFVPPPLKANAYPFGVHMRFGIKQCLGSLCVWSL